MSVTKPLIPAAQAILRSRMLGSLYGGVVGDALGGPYEFQGRGSYTPSPDMKESHTFIFKGKPLAAGSWTDDTSMMLCMAVSLKEKREFDWKDVANRFIRWHKEGYLSVVDKCFDIGNATRVALVYYMGLDRLKKVWPDTPSCNPSPAQAGNGSIMRLAPIPIFFHNAAPDTLYAEAATSSRITHSSDTCVDGCTLMSAYIVGFLRAPGEWGIQEKKEKILSHSFALWEADSVCPSPMPIESEEFQEIHQEESYKTKTVEQLRTSGWVVHTLEAALWALWRANTFEEGVLMLLPLGEDVDTVCAVYGQIAGACFGYEAIPKRWLDALQRRDTVLDPIFEGLVDVSLSKSG
ncbi:hypothetical protein FRB94_001709 [Tulasnella sp. JGI-2019a]|nr:hypothetical protein FRB94_001709 [Tulasnella sp. JGI-2019a]